jgi:mono/diheme cytochrome c family protein
MKPFHSAAIAGFGIMLLASGAHAQELGNAKEGAAFAQAACSECHAVEEKQDRSPHPKAPSFRRVAATPGMTSMALHAWFLSAHPTMPDLLLGHDDQDNLVAYILSLKSKE